ncbi:diacylglycerol kinase family protein [Tropicimonas sp. IMCC34043]|uniref:diacylglycerol/lipid kinase family protein n=1 Tax=Tropicimonas sp. IMCC34043 TaxID=2248760 RepID=UPI001E461166|nr:diacylglycerol kinase family protein [Tropicimonas sp. IMCC34043]
MLIHAETASSAPVAIPFAAGDDRPIHVIANPRSGTNARDRGALDAALQVLGERVHLARFGPGKSIETLVEDACQQGAGLIVAAGGDGTANGVAAAMLGREVPMAVLPLGTFNYFARGLGFSEDPAEAAQQILAGGVHPIRIGVVNGQVFLNNASIGLYPRILRERESIYATWGRSRLAAHWSVIRCFLRFRKPMRLRLRIDGAETIHRTALVFIARSTFQLDRFGLAGEAAISDDRFAVLVARADRRRDLWRTAAKLAARVAEPGSDYDFHSASELVIEAPSRRHLYLAYDGEKRRAPTPFTFRMSEDRLQIVLPPQHAALSGGTAST